MKRILNYEENPETFGESVDRIAKGIDSSQNDTFSIVFKNTQYLNSGMVEKFIDYPGVMFVIKGGYDDEINEKYACEFYQRNTRYTPTELYKVLQEFEKIEEKVNPAWSDLAKAKFIYDTIAKHIRYEHDEGKQNRDTSNLTGIVSGRSICAGYSIIYKEAMDRLGIDCRFVSKPEVHAWNVLSIHGKNYNLDLTWDSSEYHKGKNIGKYFGADANFEISKFHQAGPTEHKIKTSLFSEQELQNALKEIKEKPRKAKKITRQNRDLPKKNTKTLPDNRPLDLSLLANAFGGNANVRSAKSR